LRIRIHDNVIALALSVNEVSAWVCGFVFEVVGDFFPSLETNMIAGTD
jgi:hypothetical protein